MNLTLPNYFRLIRFQRLSPKEQVLHLLFFVTVVAELRDDMTAKIIANRIRSKENDISEDDVQNILANDRYHFQTSSTEDLSDRQPGEKAYHLTDKAKKELTREANVEFAKIRFWTRPAFIIPLLVAVAAVIAGLGLVGFHLATYADVSDLSWTTYKERLSYSKAATEEKSKYLLYFITQQIKFRPEMTPSAVADRLNDLGDGPVKSDTVKVYFERNPDVFTRSVRAESFMMTQNGAKGVQDKLSLVPLKDSGFLNHKWFLEYELVRAYLLIPFWISSLALIWVAGLFVGRLDAWAEKIMPE